MADVTTPSADTAVYLYLDIETIPTQDRVLMREIIAKHATQPLDESTIKPASNLTDPAKIEADLQKRLEKARADQVALVTKAGQDTDAEYRKTSLDGTTGRIACINWAFGDGDIGGEVLDVAPVCDSDSGYPIEVDFSGVAVLERQMLIRFFNVITAEVDTRARAAAGAGAGAEWDRQAENWKHTHVSVFDREGFIKDKVGQFRFQITPVVVAHHAQFDLRYVWQRAIILGVPVPSWWPHDAKAWDTTRVQDTMLLWAGVGQRIGLDRLCRALGIAGKGDIDGSKVWDAVRDGRIAEVAEYCGDDVERLRAVHRRIVGLPHIGYGFIVEDDINGGSQAVWDANPPTDPSVRDVFRTTEAEFDREEIERAEYQAEADAQRACEDGSV